MIIKFLFQQLFQQYDCFVMILLQKLQDFLMINFTDQIDDAPVYTFDFQIYNFDESKKNCHCFYKITKGQ
jgi:hypothetical protein